MKDLIMRSSMVSKCALFAISAIAVGAANADVFHVTYELPTVQNTTATFDYSGVETFNSMSIGVGGFSTNFGTGSDPIVITGAYNSNTSILGADQYGGAGGTGNYPVTFTTAGYSVTLSAVDTTNSNAPVPITYFGYWLSALDRGNTVKFYRGVDEVYSFVPTDVISLVGACGSNPYCGNPNPAFLGQNGGEPYVFLNFYDQNNLGFDKVVFSENPEGGGYESDNHTVGYFKTEGGTPVDEPVTGVLLGIGIAGMGLARRRKAV